jgi:hypothetical protein
VNISNKEQLVKAERFATNQPAGRLHREFAGGDHSKPRRVCQLFSPPDEQTVTSGKVIGRGGVLWNGVENMKQGFQELAFKQEKWFAQFEMKLEFGSEQQKTFAQSYIHILFAV